MRWRSRTSSLETPAKQQFLHGGMLILGWDRTYPSKIAGGIIHGERANYRVVCSTLAHSSRRGAMAAADLASRIRLTNSAR